MRNQQHPESLYSLVLPDMFSFHIQYSRIVMSIYC